MSRKLWASKNSSGSKRSLAFTSVSFRHFPSHEATCCVCAPRAQQRCSVHPQKARDSLASSGLPAPSIRACLTAHSACLRNAAFSEDALKECTPYIHRGVFSHFSSTFYFYWLSTSLVSAGCLWKRCILMHGCCNKERWKSWEIPETFHCTVSITDRSRFTLIW